MGIQSLSGLQYCTGLTHLFLESNNVSNISPLASCGDLTELGLYSNNISDISSLANLTNLANLELDSNQISDISPLVENVEFSEGDFVELSENPLSSDSVNIFIPQLEARGVTISH